MQDRRTEPLSEAELDHSTQRYLPGQLSSTIAVSTLHWAEAPLRRS
jgi:hypothetical protein